MLFVRSKDLKINVLEGQMLELTDDHETRQVFYQKEDDSSQFCLQ
jgi:hypothetical protein